jgi:hypothetical protein
VLVDEHGRAGLTYFPYLTAQQIPPSLMHEILQSALPWRFKPATQIGRPIRSWVSVPYLLNP